MVTPQDPAPAPDPSPAQGRLALGPLCRRRFLAHAVLLVAGLGVTGCTDDGPISVPGSGGPAASALGATPFRTLHALADAVLPVPPRVDWDAASLRVAEELATLFVEGGKVLLDNARVALQLLEHAPVATELSASRFSRASRQERQAILRAWSTSVVPVKRVIAASLRRAVMFSAYAMPETWDDLGYDGPWVQPGEAPPVLCPLGMAAGTPAPASSDHQAREVLTWEALGA